MITDSCEILFFWTQWTNWIADVIVLMDEKKYAFSFIHKILSWMLHETKPKVTGAAATAAGRRLSFTR